MADGTLAAATEATVREDLAAAYRLIALYGWDDLLATHLSARVPAEQAFLLNPYGLLFEEVTASSLVKVDMDGAVLGDAAYAVNAAGFNIHCAIYEGRADVGCVIHLHTEATVAVSCLEEGLMPLSQTAMTVLDDVAYHDYEGPALNPDERLRLQQDLGDHGLMILRNHGTLAVGENVAVAFKRSFALEQACRIQCLTLSQGRALKLPSEEARASTAALGAKLSRGRNAALAWDALRRKLDRTDPSYRD